MKNCKIKSIKAREILNSKGDLTIETELRTNKANFFSSIPSGTSKGKHEVGKLKNSLIKYQKKEILKAIKNIDEIIQPKLKGKNPVQQKEIDAMMIKLDGTENKSRLKANAILSISMAVCRAGANAKNIPLYQHIAELYGKNDYKTIPMPKPCILLIEGGLHAGNDLDIQEFMLTGFEKSFSKNLEIGIQIYHNLKNILEKKYGKASTNTGLEGGFAPPLKYPEQAIDLIKKAIENSGYKNKVGIILDCAASEFFKNKKYKTGFGTFSANSLLNYYKNLIRKYPIIKGLEDPFSEDDWQGFAKITELAESKALSTAKKQTSGKILIIGDDLIVTNPKRIKQAQKKNACNSIIVKPNQIGTVSETLEAVKLAKQNHWKIFVKHRSGETNDNFIADLAVGLNADGIMAGAPCRGERVAKYNRLLQIEQINLKYNEK